MVHYIETAKANLLITLLRPTILTSLFLLIAFQARSDEARAYAALDSLDRYVEEQAKYQEAKNDELKKYTKAMLAAPPARRLAMLDRLVQEYRHVNIDSTMTYNKMGENLAKTLGDKEYIERFELHLCTMLPVYGVVKEAMDRYEAINPDSLVPSNRAAYFTAGDLIYNYAKDFYPIDILRQRAVEKAAMANDSLINYLRVDGPEYKFYDAVRRLSAGSVPEAIKDLENLLSTIPFNNRLYARTAAIIGNAYSTDLHHTNDAIFYLARSAMSDIATGNRETTSLHRLGKLLYDKGDIDRAYNYLTLSLATAASSGSRLRSIEIADALPLVFEQVNERDKNARDIFIIAIVILSILLIATSILFLVYNKNRLKLKRVKEKLAGSLKVKDSYIRQILTLCGVYLTALESFNTLAGRKIKAGQQQELLNMIESGRILRDQLQNFYDVFDSAFLMVYPDFVDQVNELLLPDKQIVLKEGEHMSPELRILAFMRLGVDNSTQISKFLGLSLNTIYTYRNKIKTRALDRDTFEDEVKRIGKID